MGESQETCSQPNKRQRMECIIHCSENTDERLVTPQNMESWQSLLRAAEIRNHGPILDISKAIVGEEIPLIFYHRKCRTIFTMKKDLDRICKKETHETDLEINENPSKRLSRPGPSESRVYSKTCIFCEKNTKYSKNKRTREPLIQCTDIRADSSIRDVATRKMDSRLLAIVSRELVAAEAHYHRSCYRSYTKDPLTSVEKDELSPLESTDYECVEKCAYEQLYLYIRSELIPKALIANMTELTAKLIMLMKSFGINEVKESVKKHIRRKLENEFGDTLHFIQNDKGKLIVYPDNISKHDLVKELCEYRSKVNKPETDSNTLSTTALQIRQHIKQMKVDETWPPDLENMNYEIPQSLQLFILALLTGEQSCSEPSERIRRLCNFISSDMVYAVTNGKIKAQKHILLPFAVQSLTGNVELIQILNRLGHSVSYSQIEEIDTALCLKKLSIDSLIALPYSIHPNMFTTLAWDNIDRLEETLSGSGTSHRVNGIAIQAQFIGPEKLDASSNDRKTKQRTIMPYQPTVPIYNTGSRVGPDQVTVVDDPDVFNCLSDAKMKDFVWLLSRLSSKDEQTVSSWTGFNIRTRDIDVCKDNVGYLPTVNSPATDMSTVYKVLQNSLDIMHSLDLQNIVCVFDQALYAKASEIKWKHSGKFGCIILRMGVFHTICNLMSTIGKRFQDAGLRDVCIESGVISEGSITGVMEGRKYNRAVRLHKMDYEAMMRLAWKGFLAWLTEKHSQYIDDLTETLQLIASFCEGPSQDSLFTVSCNATCITIFKLFNEYLDFLRHENGDLSAFWMSYIDMVDILFGLLRASREGNWPLHLFSIHKMIPWCFAYDKLNYARFLSIYYAQMLELPTNHPHVHAEFMKGMFSVQLGDTNTFGRIPVDQTIEVTINKDTQTSGGTKGFSLKAGTIARHYLTSEYRSQYLRQLREMIRSQYSKFSHHDLHCARIKQDEADVQKITDLLEDCWVNPFNPTDTELVKISSGTVAPDPIKQDLLGALSGGEEAYSLFKTKCIHSEKSGEHFFDKMTKMKLKTFTEIKKKSVTSVQAKEIVLKADRNLFGHMILIAQSRDLHMRDVLAHPLGPLPWSLANSDDSLRKTNKSSLSKILVKGTDPADNIPQPSATIIDGMCMVQRLRGNDRTFGELADSALSAVLHEGSTSNRIDVVFDVYNEKSIKNAKRDKISTSSVEFNNLIQQWRKILGSSTNKTNLVKFFVEQWKKANMRDKLQGKVMFVTCQDVCYKISKETCEEVSSLNSSQEEADTRMFLHALHAAQDGYKSVVIAADDTDVLVLCLALNSSIPCHLYQKSGTANRVRYIDIHKIALKLGNSVCSALPGLHALTGCDTVSSFAGRGKSMAFKQMNSDYSKQDVYNQLGRSFDIDDKLFENLQQIVCRMYSSSTQICLINDLRYQLFLAKRGQVDSSQLPPCADSLKMHITRANYQAAIWRRSLQNYPTVPDPTEYGWILSENNQLAIKWMQGNPAPDSVLNSLACNCKRKCTLPDCSCMNNGLTCTDMCSLQNCDNQANHKDDDIEIDFESDSDDDDV